MFEILHNFEQTAVRFSPMVLIGFGVAAFFTGLFFWLGGLGIRRILPALVGGFSGAVIAVLIFGSNIVAVLAIAILAAFIAIILKRIFSAVLAAALITCFALIIMAKPYIEKSNAEITRNPQIAPASAQTIYSPSESMKIVKVYATDCYNGLKYACSEIRIHNWIILVVVMLIFIGVAFFLWRLALAFCYATFGTMLIFAGMISLLLYKPSAPISCIYNNALFYLTVFLVMIGFGTFEQLLLCSRTKRQPATKEKNQGKQKT